MKILDYLFYIALCVAASIGLLTYSIHEDMYFALSSFDLPQKHEVYEKDQWDINATNILNVDIEKIDSSRYIISYLDKDINNNTNLYGMIFYPNKYSTMLQKGVWQNIATNTKIHSHIVPLLNVDVLKMETKQYSHNINTALFQRDDSNIYLFLNATVTKKPLTTRNYIFRTSLTNIVNYIESKDKQLETENIDLTKEKSISFPNSLFTLYAHPTLSIFAKLNASLSHKPIQFVGNKGITRGMILPFYTHMQDNMPFFGIFNMQMQPQEIAKPHNNNFYNNPLITPLHTYYDLNNKTNEAATHLCLALYQNKSISSHNNISNLGYQLCKVSNGEFQFEDLQESKNIRVGDFISVAVFGRYVILVYTAEKNKSLHLAIWSGTDFIPLKELDTNTNGNIISPHILTHGSYAYVVYAKSVQNKVNVITINELYITNLLASQNNAT